MIPVDFHPIVRRWWEAHFRDPGGRVLPPTDAQLEGWRAIRGGGHTLVAAPTGSGKTLAAFLTAVDQLLREGLEQGALPDEVRVIYVSPLKALSADIHKNLAEPRREMRRLAEEMGYPLLRITAAVRSGDTPQAERAAMLKTPPHILVTTPESLYLLLTARKSRAMLATARVVIVDEIHAVLESRRGAHLALSLERLDHVCGRRLQRIGLSATQKPIEEVAQFLAGLENGACAIVDRGHRRVIDLAIEVPGSPLEAVMSHEVWQEIYERLVALVEAHRTTLIFVNTRRLAERMAHQLSERLGAEHVAAHHGSLAKEARLAAEARLREGRLKVLVATASLELGIDIGHVDLVCQVSSPHRIATLLQRVGRSGHTVTGLPKGRVFPLTRDDLIECAAMVRAALQGELDRIHVAEQPLDVLAQQVVAESAAEEWDEKALYHLFCRAYPYRGLQQGQFEDVVQMLATGYASKRGRRAALVHYDAVHRKLRARPGSRMTAILSGGAIPEVFDYRVLLEPEGQFIGTLNEDFAVESLPGDVFQLGNTSWRILGINAGTVRVADAEGQPPSMPFWLGEAHARSDEVSAAVSRLRAHLDARLPGPETPRSAGELDAAAAWLEDEYALTRSAAEQLATYLGEGKRALGVIPTHETLVLERFFDEAGGMQLVLHAPLGSRINKAWGLALRKKFCQSFNFELQAAATEDGLILSLAPAHSFQLDEVFRYLRPDTVRETLCQAVLASPIFETRWRWVTTIALAVPRNRRGARVPAQIQRMMAEEILAAVFPDAIACQDNLQGARELPAHPLVDQAMRDSLEGAMDLPQLVEHLRRVMSGEVQCVARDTPEPSVLCHEILNSEVYTFLDDAPLEERRTRAVYTRRATEPRSADDLGALDPAAIQRVREEAWPQADTPDELHDALMLAGFIRADEVGRSTSSSFPPPARGRAREGVSPSEWPALFQQLVTAGRAFDAKGFWVALERFDELNALIPQRGAPHIPERLRKRWSREDAALELARSRLEVLGPVTASGLAESLDLPDTPLIDAALAALEAQGKVLRGRFTSPAPEAPLEWCDRRLLARIHRYTLNRLRAEVEPVSAADFMRFLVRWQHAVAEDRMRGVEGLAAVIAQLDGFELAAGAWEHDVLAARVEDYAPEQLDTLCLSGRVAWGRLTPATGSAKAPLKSSPVALMLREHAPLWRNQSMPEASDLSSEARAVHAALRSHGASFFHELASASGLLKTQVERALGELAGAGRVTADSFSGLRALLAPQDKRKSFTGRRSRRASAWGVDTAGRWALLEGAAARPSEEERVEAIARILLKRYGVVFRALLGRESRLPTWRELALVYRRLEARGEIRGGRFVKGFGGEQFALPEAVGRLRAVRKQPATGELLAFSAADPLNLVGILTPEARVPAIATNRVLLRDGVPIAALEGGELRRLAESDLGDDSLRTLFWRRSDTDLKIGSSTPSDKSHAALRQRLQHGSAGIARRQPLGSR
ncbi:MAG: ATP-dependent DNA helicase [Betaproteobacteria bacterium RIFCSPLOWO2_12_FULL_66_14]|nr:MAG: ATP-dependent DNA helicase [Betaproteobacteria bacterium RIFCSPLOWO2_12_FULL_66_14]